LQRLILVALLLLLIAHLFIEGARWQMAPAYLAALLLFVAGTGIVPMHAAGRITLIVGVLLLGITSIGLSIVLPVFRLPQPTGKYAVGTSTIELTDSSRVEDAGPQAGSKRRVVVQLWYPASLSRKPSAKYMKLAETFALTSYRSTVPTHSRLDAPIAVDGAPFPLLLFGGGWRGRRTEGTFLTEELASHGYIVAAIDHPYNAHRVAFSDGLIADTTVTQAIGGSFDIAPEAFIQAWDKELAKWTADERFVLDTLLTMNSDPDNKWFHRMNPNEIGAVGHSFGGSAAVGICSEDPRVRAAINMDGYLFSALDKRAAGKKLMVILEGAHVYKSDDRLDKALGTYDFGRLDESLRRFGGYVLFVAGANHEDFSDQPLMSPLRRISQAGTLPATQTHAIVRAYVLAFFDKTLQGQATPLLDGNSAPYSAATFEKWTPGDPAPMSMTFPITLPRSTESTVKK
jgi:dienelactone hydrolase